MGIEKKRKEKDAPVERYGPTNSVKNIEYRNWVMMPKECEKLSDK